MKRVASLLVLAAWSVTGVAAPKKEPAKKDPPKPAPAPPVVDQEPPATPFPESNDPRRIIGVLDVRVEGAPPEVGVQFQRDVGEEIDQRRFFFATRARMHDRMTSSTKWTEGCVVGDCLREVKVQTNADLVLLVTLSGSGTSYGWVVTLVGTERGKVVGQTSERCDVCTVSEALSAATKATLALLDHVPADLKAEPVVVAKPIEPPPPPPENHHLAGGVLTAAGAALAVAGAIYYFAQSHDKNGLVLAGAGGGLLVGGVVTLTF